MLVVIKVWRSDATDGSKILWTVLVVLLPLIGIIAWYFAGPGDKALNRL
ncbi:MAG: PLD nuclease N-terminal domain-containing protein [Perlucidibaca sp.]